jgi:alkyl hydroperoxide reductase subunit AhpC
MATLNVTATAASNDSQQACRSTTLREWLAGSWGVLFSNPEHFAPHPTTPAGFITLLADDFVVCGAKPIKVAGRSDETRSCWLDYAGADCADVVIDTAARDSTVVDLCERSLASMLTRMESPYVVVVDPLGRCRSTMTYRLRHGERSRTIDDVLSVVQVLRAGAPTSSQPEHERLAAG